ncbi:MAG TPA: hypothetical protein VFJ29_05140 [Candidatus Kapabacteria bacterium]|nr:hypothetical protein [Candidatus Kapabacteria bacterium]
MRNKLLSLFAACAVCTAVCIAVSSCKSSPTAPVQTPAHLTGYGVYVINQGGTNIPSTIDCLDLQNGKYFSNIVLGSISLGSDGNDLVKGNGDSLYLVMENSNRIYLISDTSGKILATDTSSSFNIPYKMVLLNDSIAAIAEYNSNSVTIYNLRTMTVLHDITVGDNPQGLAYADSKLYVACPGSGTVPEKLIYVLSPAGATLTYASLDPDPVAVKSLGDSLVLVLCSGTYLSSPSDAALDFVDPKTDNVVAHISLPTNVYSFALDGNDCYMQAGNVILHTDISKRAGVDTAISNAAFVSLYGITVDTATHNIYVSDGKNYTSAGALYQCDPKGHLLQTYTTGIIPGPILVVH